MSVEWSFDAHIEGEGNTVWKALPNDRAPSRVKLTSGDTTVYGEIDSFDEATREVKLHEVWMLRFEETGGYDCMTGAWVISLRGEVVLRVDQRDFGQPNCDYEFRSERARLVAELCLGALMSDEV